MFSEIYAFTDGSFSTKNGGGWGYVFYTTYKKKTLVWYGQGRQLHTTNQRMELTALIKCIKKIPKCKTLILHLDSKYVLTGLSDHLEETLQKLDGWYVRKKDPKNKDLWDELMKDMQVLIKRSNVKLKWVKGHSGLCKGNTIADKLARNLEIKDWSLD